MTLYFPDEASYQAGLSMKGALAVCAKGTQGTGYQSPAYIAQKQEAQACGTYFTGYSFAEQGNGAGQADNAFAVAGGNTPWMLDLEPIDPPDGASYPSIADGVAFIRRFRDLGGIINLLYLPSWYWARQANGLGGASLQPFADLGMHLWSSDYASYTDGDDGGGWQPYGGMTPLIWQYTCQMSFNGSPNVDFSAFRGKYAGRQDASSVAAALGEFESIARTGQYPPAPAPAPLPGTPVAVPAIRGMTAARAEKVLAVAHLTPETEGIPAAFIATSTAPAATGKVPLGSKVKVNAAPGPELLVGSTGAWVEIAQTDLNRGGAHLGVDGDFESATLAAVLAFQKAGGLELDGIIGPQTWAALGSL